MLEPRELKNYGFIGICLLAIYASMAISTMLDGKLAISFYHTITIEVVVIGSILIGIVIGMDIQYTACKRKLVKK